MRKDYTHISFVLDRSGSMEGVTVATIDAVNEFVNKQKLTPGQVTFSLVLFDDQYDLVYDFVNLEDVPKLDTRVYFARGMTSLHDAIGKTINSVGQRLAAMQEKDRPEKVLFAITTDGLENNSKEFNRTEIAEMIKHQDEKYNWEFVFMGADQDSYATAGQLNIPVGNTKNFEKTSGGIHLNAVQMCSSASAYRSENYTKGKFFSTEPVVANAN